MNKTTIKSHKKFGRGVFASVNIKKKSIVESCHVLAFNEKEADLINKTNLGNYHYEFSKNLYLLALGNGSLYNHSYDPNAYYVVKKNCIKIVALRDIKKGEEVLINYNGNPKSKNKLWFEVK